MEIITADEFRDPTTIQKIEIQKELLFSSTENGASEDDIEEARRLVKEKQIVPDEFTIQGINLAKNMIIDLEREFRLVEKTVSDMHVALLSPEIYERIYFLLTKIEGANNSSAGYVQDFDEVLVTLKDEPYYQRASEIFHEFIHMFIDRHVQVFANLEDNTTDTAYARSGLSVDRHITERKASVPKVTTRGDLLNELGNYLEQNTFMLIALNTLFKKESLSRENFLDRLDLKNEGKVLDLTVRRENGDTVKVRMTQNCIHPDSEGNLNASEMFFYMQLASDINRYCSQGENGGDFRKLLLNAKIHPERQNELMKLVDSKFGKGFYSKLKSARYETEDMLDLLVQVQSEIYPHLN